MSKQVYYIKQGRRYVPVREYDPDFQHSLPEGSHLMVVNPSGSSCKYSVDPAFAQLLAAGIAVESKIVEAIQTASTWQPSTQPLTEEEKQAWENLNKVFGDKNFGLYRESAAGIAKATIDALIKEQEKLMNNPAVKKAFDHYLTVCKLSVEQSQG